MSLPAAAPGSFRTALRRFRRNRRGSAAVEFALVAPVFFALLFAIIETAIVFFAGQVLETVTQDSARMIMTGQAQTANYTQAQFKTPSFVRQRSRQVLFDCTNGIYVDVKSYPTFPDVTITEPIDGSKNFIPPTSYCPGERRRHRRGADVLSMAAVRHRARLQHREPGRQQAAVDPRPPHSATSPSSPRPLADRTKR